MVAQGAIDAVSDVGTAVAGLLMASQLPTMYGVIFKKTGMDKISAMPTVGQASNFAAWVVYALVFGDPNLLRVNVIGCAFSALYFLVFAFWSTGANRVQFFKLLATFVAVFAGVICGVLLSGASHATQVNVLGYVAVGCNVLMYVFPFAAIRLALKTMDPAAIPLLLTLAGTACSGLWLLYGLMTDNWFVAGPNVAGVALNCGQLGLIAYINMRARAAGPRKSISSDDGEDEYARLTTEDA